MTNAIIWLIMRYLRQLAAKHYHGAVEIRGKGKHYPDYLIFSCNERFSQNAKKRVGRDTGGGND